MHGALLGLRQLFDFTKGRNDQRRVEGQDTGAIVTRFLQKFKETRQQKLGSARCTWKRSAREGKMKASTLQ